MAALRGDTSFRYLKQFFLITSYFKLDPSLPIFDYMNGSLFDKLILIVDLHIYYLKQP
jgi:hypothetical protein